MKSRMLYYCLWVTLGALAGAGARAAAPTSATTAGARAFDARSFGATGDGQTLDTDAINKAIEAAATAGGGTVYFSAGTYASYSVHLKSNVALYLDHGATILAADPPATNAPGGYDAPEPNEWDKYQDFGHTHWHNSLIWGENLENISILGPGRIFGKGLSRGMGRVAPLPGESPAAAGARRGGRGGDAAIFAGSNDVVRTADRPFGYPSPRDTLAAGIGNKAIALKNCRNVILRDFTIFHGGHFGILATGVDNFTLDNLKIDTNRDGIDIDCCVNVRVSNCTVNSPSDDGICLKSSFGLGRARATENVTINNCQVSGYEEGSLLDGTYKRRARGRGGPTGRIKFGTEANGGFKNVTISNCVFDFCRGLALEEVDGGPLEDVSISNITMRDIVNAPIFIRLGARLRGPNDPPVGAVRRINISDIVAYNVAPDHGILISGLPGHPIEDVRLSNIHIVYRGGGTKEQGAREVPEYETEYPEPSRFGTIPSWGMFARHVKGLDVSGLDMRILSDDLRPAFILDDVNGAEFRFIKAQRSADVPTFMLKKVEDFNVYQSRPVPDTRLEHVAQQSF
jgi:polygalacturonase